MAAFTMGTTTEFGDLISGLVFGTGVLPMIILMGVFVLLEIASAMWMKANSE